MEVLEHQREALYEIVSRARAYFRGDWRDLPVQPRWASLMLGPTGTGKTAVAAMAAATLTGEISGESVSTLIIATPSWIPLGANNRGAKETLGVIAEHIARHNRTILVLDELDKLVSGAGGISGLGNGDSWQSYIRNELYSAILDGRWPSGLTLPETDDDAPDVTIDDLTTKLRDTVFIVAIGTFQTWFDSSGSRRSMGFGAEINPAHDELTADIIARMLPRELANRFNSTLIRIPELQPGDYHRIANEVESQLPLRMQQPFQTEVERRIPGAIAAKKGVRFLEEAMMEVLKNLPPAPAATIAECIDRGFFKTLDLEPCTL